MSQSGASIGRYLVKRKLAEGGMAELFLCTALGPGGFEKEVVIKRIKTFISNDRGFVEMFKTEARLASRLNHANVVQIFDFDRHEGEWFIAMEYVRGASLFDLRRRCLELARPLPPLLVAEIGAQVARGLQHAHALTDDGVPLALVHRDVSPHNVLLGFDGGVKLADFGIAKAGAGSTAPGVLKGKFAYMSPEQARGEKVDARSDVFALGITLWEALTGERLFKGDADFAVLLAVQKGPIAAPALINRDVPVQLSDIVLRALCRPIGERYQTAHELERALAEFVLGNAASTDDVSVGLFLRQVLGDEPGAGQRSAGAQPALEAPTVSRTQPNADPTKPDTEPTGLRPAEEPRNAAGPSGSPKGLLPWFLTACLAILLCVTGGLGFIILRGRAAGALPSVERVASAMPAATGDQGPASHPVNLGARAAEEVEPPVTEELAGAAPDRPRPERAPAPALRIAAASPPTRPMPPPRPEPPSRPQPPGGRSPTPKPYMSERQLQALPVAQRAQLVVEALPFGELFINERKHDDIWGTQELTLPPGRYAIKLRHPSRVQTGWVTLKPGQTTTVRFHPLAR